MRYIFAFFLFLLPLSTFATINYLTVNHTTKELYWAESGHSEEGFIGWEIVPEKNYHADLQKYEALGYTLTKFPYKLDILVALMILIPISVLFIRKKKRRN